jgi:hypothetical protein
MSNGPPDYELLTYGDDHEQEADIGDQKSLIHHPPQYDRKGAPDTATTVTRLGNEEGNESAKVALHPSIIPLLVSFIVHIVPAAATIAIAQLSFHDVYWFDQDSSTDQISPFRHFTMSLNELLNLIQFVAKIHEILLCMSVGAMVMHRVRVRLISKHGLPLGMLVGGYSVGSAEYLLSAAFRSGFNRRFWPLTLLIFVFTLLANTFGPTSAIALLPNLDWWDMKNPYGAETLPVLFAIPKEEWWPLDVGRNHTLLPDRGGRVQPPQICFSDEAFKMAVCPASGYNDLLTWAIANSATAIAVCVFHVTLFDYSTDASQANVTTNDGLSPAQRRVRSRLTERDGNVPGVAITTSLSHTTLTMIGTFWEMVRIRDYPVNDVIRPQIGMDKNEISYQPLVQVQCIPILLDNIQVRGKSVTDNHGINTFSTQNASAIPIPDWLYEYEYNPPNKAFTDDLGRLIARQGESTNVTWIDPSTFQSNLSLAAIITTPTVVINGEDTNLTHQSAVVHFCSIDARWVGSSPTYDPTEHLVVAHNITDLLLFAKQKDANEAKISSDMRKWGVSPALNLSLDWAESLTFATEFNNRTAPLFSWYLSPFITASINETASQQPSTSNSTTNPHVSYLFDPTGNDPAQKQFLSETENYLAAASETVSTLLGLQITDALARIQSARIQTGVMQTKTLNATHITVTALASRERLKGTAEINITKEEIADAPARYTLSIQRYGYGYGFRTVTVYFGLAVLLSHVLLTLIYIFYSLYDFFFVRHWTSSSWGDIGELAALLINSPVTEELQNTCAGIGDKGTWRKTVRIRETGEGHLGAVVGEGGWLTTRPVGRGLVYGHVGKEGELRKRRGSV